MVPGWLLLLARVGVESAPGARKGLDHLAHFGVEFKKLLERRVVKHALLELGPRKGGKGAE
jgi:hypothetical protein